MITQDRCIASVDLVSGFALSTHHQPYLARLIEAVRSADRDLVVIAGAGISMDAGLPSWSRLVANIAEANLTDVQRRAFEALDIDGLERRAETILHLAGKARPHVQFYEFVRDGLFQDQAALYQGELAQAIARLAVAYPRRVSLVTTNFDWLLELAGEQVASLSTPMDAYSFDTWQDWEALDDDQHRQTVMHLHGRLPRETSPALQPLVLTENDFLQYGSAIRQRVIALLKDKLVVLLGVSLTDANLLAPLHQVGQGAGNQFVLSVPALSADGLSEAECADYATLHATALRDYLNVRPILLKSYAQVTQVVSELALATAEPSTYCAPGKRVNQQSTLQYGYRFKAALKAAYTSLGASSRTGAMDDWTAVNLSAVLHESTHGRGGPVRVLKGLRDLHRGECADEENLGVFLWLRDLPDRAGSRYAIRLMCSSAYAHWKSWSAFRLEVVNGGSAQSAVQAAFLGHAVSVNIDPTTHSGAWQGSFAVPLVTYDFRSQARAGTQSLDRLAIGALAVNSDRIVRGTDGVTPGELSALAVLTEDELRQFTDSLYSVAQGLFG